MPDPNKGAIWAVVCLAALVAAEVYIDSAHRKLAGERASLEREAAQLRLRIADDEKAVANELTQGQTLTAEKEKRIAGGAPNHARILAILKALEAEKARFGPADPLKLNMRYAHAWMGMAANLMDDPDYAKKERAVSLYDSESNNRLYLRSLAAKGVDAGQMAVLLADQRLDSMEAVAIAQKEGLASKDVSQAAEAAQKDVQDRIADLLGPDNMPQFQEYGKVANGSFSADALQNRLSYEAAPMDEKEYTALATLLGGQSPQFILEGRYDGTFAAKVQTILTPDQFRVFEEILQESK